MINSASKRTVTITHHPENKKDPYLFVLITFKSAISEKIRITRKETFNAIIKAIGINKIHTGDEIFDTRTSLSTSNKPQLIALLNEDLRNRIKQLELWSKEFTITENQLETKASLSKLKSSRMERQFVRLLKFICRDIAHCTDIKGGLLHNVIYDRNQKVCLINFDILIDHYTLNNIDPDTIKKLLNHRNPEIRFKTIQHMGKAGIDFINTLLNKKLLTNSKLFVEILSLLQRYQYKKSLKMIKKLYVKTNNVSIKIETLKYFTLVGNESLNSLLIAQLDNSNINLVLHAIEALGTCGKIDAIEKIITVINRLSNFTIRRAANATIKAIQSRLGNVDFGWISLPEKQNSNGALSIDNQNNSGDLSIARDDKEL